MHLIYTLAKVLPYKSPERLHMKKVLVSSVLALALIAASDASFAATTKPTIKKPAAGTGEEGSAAHEAGEGSMTQKKEGTSTAKKVVIKKKKAVKKAK